MCAAPLLCSPHPHSSTRTYGVFRCQPRRNGPKHLTCSSRALRRPSASRRRFCRTPPSRCESAWRSMATRSGDCSIASSARPTGLPGLRLMSRRCGSSRLMPIRMQAEGKFGEIEELEVRIGFGEYLAQILGGIPMSQSEIVRLSDLGLSTADVSGALDASGRIFCRDGNTAARRARLVEIINHHTDPTYRQWRPRRDAGSDPRGDAQVLRKRSRALRAAMAPEKRVYPARRDFADVGSRRVRPDHCRKNSAAWGSARNPMCVVSEELSRGYIGVGSLGTRSEIAAELILGSGTEEQKRKWLPLIASGEILPTAVFTEPNTGSDLASLKTRAVRDGNVYKVYGNKTWITHPVRADLMTLLVRTDPKQSRLSRPLHAACGKAARRRRQSVPRERHVRHRDRGARLSRHEGIRDRLRWFRGEDRKSARRRSRARASSN